VFAVAVQAVAWYAPAAQLEQVLQTPPSRYLRPAQLVQLVAEGPLQVAQLASQAVHTVFAVAVQAVAW
jgi:hypothetical protein